MRRELGEQFQADTLRPVDIANVPAYHEVIRHGLARLEDLDLDQIEASVDAAIDSSPQEPETKNSPEPVTIDSHTKGYWAWKGRPRRPADRSGE